MPFARIDMIRGNSVEFRQTVGDVVYQAMHEILGAPKDDRFQVIAEHAPEDFIFDPEFLGIHRTQGCIFGDCRKIGGQAAIAISG